MMLGQCTHVGGDQGLILSLGRAVQDLLGRRVSGQSQSGEGIHNQINPEKLNRLEH